MTDKQNIMKAISRLQDLFDKDEDLDPSFSVRIEVGTIYINSDNQMRFADSSLRLKVNGHVSPDALEEAVKDLNTVLKKG